jgi:antitoxin component YwqK of YwqJK toxin-antitoxin module
MSILHDAYTALLAGLTYRIGKEIHWYDKNNNSITIEPIDVENEKYIKRGYYSNGQKLWEAEYQNDKRHGKSLGWYDNGQRWWIIKYKNGFRHGKLLRWFDNGQKEREEKYKNGFRHGKFLSWGYNGIKECEVEYQNGQIIKEIL